VESRAARHCDHDACVRQRHSRRAISSRRLQGKRGESRFSSHECQTHLPSAGGATHNHSKWPTSGPPADAGRFWTLTEART